MQLRELYDPEHLRRGLVVALALFFAGLPGCGKNRVTVDVDVDSFIHPDDLSGSYDAPAGVPEAELDLAPISVNLVEGFNGVGPAEEMSLDVAVTYDNVSGQGEARFTVFFAATPEELFSTPAVGSVAAQLEPQTVTRGNTRITADQRLLDLFELDRIYMGLRFRWRPETNEALQGDYTITSINAHVVSTIEIF